VGLVDHHPRAERLGGVTDRLQRRDGAVHAEHRIGDDQPRFVGRFATVTARSIGSLLEHRSQALDVAVVVNDCLGVREPDRRR